MRTPPVVSIIAALRVATLRTLHALDMLHRVSSLVRSTLSHARAFACVCFERLALSSVDRRVVRSLLVSLLLAIMLFVGIAHPFSLTPGLFATASAHGLAAQNPSAKPKPNLFDPHANATSTNHLPVHPTLHVNRPTNDPAPLQRPGNITMPPGLLPLRPDAATSFVGQDGRFEVDVPAGAITTADEAAASGGKLQLSLRQIVGASGSSAGGSGLISFGTYLVQVVDGSGVLTTQGLHKPITFKVHLPKTANALDLKRAYVILNGSLPVHVSGAPTSLIVPDIRSGNNDVPGLGKYSSQTTTYDPKQQALITTYTLGTPSTSVSWDTNSPVAVFGNPDPFTADLSGGGLTTSIPLDIPTGPGGLTPPVALTYNSAGVTEQHNIQGAAGWVGEGWNLSFGSISWAEYNNDAGCTSNCGNGWEDTWQLSDPFGTAVELIPPDIFTKTYFDNTGNAITPSPVRWHATPENYAKVYSYTGPLTLPNGGGVNPPCFRVFLANGIMEEFGCTADSLEYYYTNASGTIQDYIYAWNLDLITDRHGNQIHITYRQDIAGSTYHYVRDAVPATVEWDSPNCLDAQQMCTGANWAPLMRVQFTTVNTLDSGRLLNTPDQTCNTGWHLRCDDPVDLTPTGGTVAPLVVSTLALEDALVQVRTSGSGAWNTLKDYQFSYNQNGPRTTTDASTGKAISAAGYFLLGRLTVLGTDGSTALPSSSFSYIVQPQFYVDSNYHPNPLTNCGPSWNTGTGSGCFLWSQNQPGNSYYLRAFDNGMGKQEVFYWQLARNNSHGVPSGGDPRNPFWCNGYQTTSPCQETDDQNWSRVVLTKTESTVQRSSSLGTENVLSRVIYSYYLTYPLPAQECSDCVAGMYWGSQNDGDYLDYYDGKFMGFAEADVSNPDGSVEYHKYLSTEGYGLYDASVPCLSFTPPCHVSPWWDLGNAAHGREYEADYYDTNGTTLLKQVTTQYEAICPPSGVSATPPWSTTLNGNAYKYTWDNNLVAALDHGNPVAVCDVRTRSTDTSTFDGASDPFNVPHRSTSYLYDSYGRVTDTTTGADTGLKAEYYDNSDLTNLKFTRLDATVNNVWGTGSPFPTIDRDTFSVRWTGYVKPQYTGTYTFYTLSDDGVRLSVNGVQLVNNWTDHGATENSGTIALTAGQLYPITLEYYENGGGAAIELSWSEASQPKQIIPATALFTRADGGGGTAFGSVPATVAHLDYIWNDAVTATSTSATGIYLLNTPADVFTQDGGNTVHYTCKFIGYDSVGWAPGQQSGLTQGEIDGTDQYTDCGTAANGFAASGLIRTSYSPYDAWGNLLATIDPDANAGNTAHKGCSVGSSTYTTCIAYDTTFHTLPTTTTNALNQFASVAYGTPAANNGFGLWPISLTDVNGQATTTSYDALGRTLSTTLPGESSGLATTSMAYTFWCNQTGAQAPCVEVDQIQRIDSSSTSTTRSFYDGFGRLVETRKRGPVGQDIVQYADYDPSGRPIAVSVPYLVPAYTGSPGAAAFSIPDANQPTTQPTYDGLGRTISVKDPLSQTSTTSYVLACGWAPYDPACYEATMVRDPLVHQTYSLTDALGRVAYSTVDTGNSSSTYAFYAESHSTYDANGNLVKITHPNGSATTYTYDAAGRTRGMTDPDRGTETYGYDANGNVTQTTDARGAGSAGSGPTTLMGDTTVEPTQDALLAGQAIAFHFVASSSGTADTAYVYVDSGNLSPTIQVGLYADNGSNQPGTLLAQATISSPTNGAWNSVALPGSPAVTSGQTYWIAVLGPASGNDLYFRDNDLGTSDMEVYSSSTALNSLPSTWSSGGSSPGVRASAYIKQNGTPGSSGGIIYAGYDGLNRQLWRNTTNSPTNAYVTYSYDSTTGGNYGIGRLTGETFTSPGGGALGSGAYSYTYDLRGQTASTTMTLNGASYPVSTSYNDAGQPLTLTYPTGETVTAGYSAQGWLGSLTRTLGGTTTTLLDAISYTGIGGATGQITGAHLGNATYLYSASFDNLARPTDVKTQRASDSATLFEEVPGYDAAGNITSETITLPTGTDVQRFCYDDLNRLVWAGSTGTPSCGGTLMAGTLTSAYYTATYGYDTLNRLTSTPQGGYTYGDSAHLDAATQVQSGTNTYTASYDAAGNMICRAPTGSASCSGGAKSGQQLSWDNEGRLVAWQNAPSSPTSTDQYLYDGEGNRVVQVVTSGGTTTTTVYVGDLETVSTTSGTTTTTTYYYAGGQRIALAVNGTLSYLASDLLGSATVALNASGVPTASQLYAPYGTVRYQNGTMLTEYGFTGQRVDSATGLDYYGARYYDPALGQFIAADTVLQGVGYSTSGHGARHTPCHHAAAVQRLRQLHQRRKRLVIASRASR